MAPDNSLGAVPWLLDLGPIYTRHRTRGSNRLNRYPGKPALSDLGNLARASGSPPAPTTPRKLPIGGLPQIHPEAILETTNHRYYFLSVYRVYKPEHCHCYFTTRGFHSRCTIVIKYSHFLTTTLVSLFSTCVICANDLPLRIYGPPGPPSLLPGILHCSTWTSAEDRTKPIVRRLNLE